MNMSWKCLILDMSYPHSILINCSYIKSKIGTESFVCINMCKTTLAGRHLLLPSKVHGSAFSS